MVNPGGMNQTVAIVWPSLSLIGRLAVKIDIYKIGAYFRPRFSVLALPTLLSRYLYNEFQVHPKKFFGISLNIFFKSSPNKKRIDTSPQIYTGSLTSLLLSRVSMGTNVYYFQGKHPRKGRVVICTGRSQRRS